MSPFAGVRIFERGVDAVSTTWGQIAHPVRALAGAREVNHNLLSCLRIARRIQVEWQKALASRRQVPQTFLDFQR
jgi:hypothetical protein